MLTGADPGRAPCAAVKSIDPVHLLTVRSLPLPRTGRKPVAHPILFVRLSRPLRPAQIGSEGFFGASTPLYLYSNPGPWAALEGVDFVRRQAFTFFSI